MNFTQLIKNKILPMATCVLFASGAMAQETQQAATAPAEKSNLLAILLIVTAVVLAFVIWGMGQALVTISRHAMEKNRAAGKALSMVLLLGFSLLSQFSFAQTGAAAADAAKDLPNYGGLSANTFYAFVGVIIVEIAAVIFLALSIRRIYQEIAPETVSTAQGSKLGEWWASLDKKFFTKAVAVEKEADVLLDHDYDGIRELDNALPPWWKYGFIFTIAVAFIYSGYFAFGSGKNPTQEYQAEMDKAKIENEAYEANNKDKIDETKVPMADAAGIKAGEAMFEANCIACHLKGGAGSVGPNLTDDYWLHKGSLNDIFKTIKNGYPDKGMQSWSNKFNPKEISQLASYVKSLRGTNPPGAKAAQGDLYVEEGASSAPAKDSAAKAAPAVTIKDSTATAKPAK